ncbi:hypothetical protein ACODNH_19015 [Haloarcula sp. NS06]|uniref:hypothetical protein n=1 Tax=Haloarcula sp. NS06 TaxID=3409688 RepID=UPI003DA717F5
MAYDDRSHSEDFWVERAAQTTGLETIGRHLRRLIGADTADRRPDYGPYLLVMTLVSVDIFVLPVIGYLQTGRYLTLANPAELLILPAWLIVTWSLLRLRRLYWRTVETLPDPDPEISSVSETSRRHIQPIIRRLIPSGAGTSFETIFPTHQKVGLLLLGWGYHVGWILTDPSAGSYVMATAGELVAILKFGVIIPLFYYPIGVEFLTMFLAIHILLPYRISRQGLIDFEDMYGYGGLRSVGHLSRSSTVHFFGLLSLYAGFLTIAKGVSTNEIAHQAFILTGTFVGAVLFFIPVVWVGFHMQSLKYAKINAIVDQTKMLGPDNHAFPETRVASPTDAIEYTHEYVRLSVVKEMKDYPIDVFALRDFFYALPIPFAINVLTAYLQNNLLTF